MYVESTAEGFADYHSNRPQALPLLFERLARISGLPKVAASLDGEHDNGCALTPDGLEVSVNTALVERLAGDGEGFEPLPLAVADTIVMLHEIGRARDCTDPTFFIEAPQGSRVKRSARRFFNTSIDDMCIDLRLSEIPLVARYFSAFNARLVACGRDRLPDHIQFVHALRSSLFGVCPAPDVSVAAREALTELFGKADQACGRLLGLLDYRQSYEERHRRADEAILDTYYRLLVDDLSRFDIFTIGQLHEQQSFFGLPEAPNALPPERAGGDEGSYEDDIYSTVSDFLDGIDAAAIEEAESTAEVEAEDEIPGLVLPRVGTASEGFVAEGSKSDDYWKLVRRWNGVIDGVADVFLELSRPVESILVPRYRAIPSPAGMRFHPNAAVDASIQLATGVPQAIWQPIRWRRRVVELEFSGLDIFMLLDVSASMSGENADNASAMCACLIEGLERARRRAARDAKHHEVDVRTQLLAFGEGWAELSPLHRELTASQKETACYSLLNPTSNFTLVNGALKHVSTSAGIHRERTALCLVVSDGLFSDNLPAIRTVRDMPENAYTCHVNIGPTTGVPLTRNYESIRNPKLLPGKLLSLLESYLDRTRGE